MNHSLKYACYAWLFFCLVFVSLASAQDTSESTVETSTTLENKESDSDPTISDASPDTSKVDTHPGDSGDSGPTTTVGSPTTSTLGSKGGGGDDSGSTSDGSSGGGSGGYYSRCADGKDNDNDGLTDLDDPGCTSLNDNSEDNEPVEEVVVTEEESEPVEIPAADTEQQGFFSTITGAVTGSMGPTTLYVSWIFILVLLAAITGIVYMRHFNQTGTQQPTKKSPSKTKKK